MVQRLAWEKPMLRKPKNAFLLLLEEGGLVFVRRVSYRMYPCCRNQSTASYKASLTGRAL